jgi:hypothetical protein
MPTTFSVQIQTYDFGASLSDVTLRHATTDALIATADSCPEISTDAGVYVAAFGETSAIAAGVYRLRAMVNGSPLNRWVTLTGVDGELAYSRVERAVELDSATATKIDSIKTKTDNLPADPADASDIASSFGTVNGKLDTIDDLIDTEVSAITTEVAKIPKVGSTHRYTQVASDSGAKRADVSITDTP